MVGSSMLKGADEIIMNVIGDGDVRGCGGGNISKRWQEAFT